MMIATDEAISFAKTLPNSERVLLYLSEAPIGDEYQILDDQDWKDGEDFERLCAEKGITVWEQSGPEQ